MLHPAQRHSTGLYCVSTKYLFVLIFLHKILERTYSNVTRWSCEAIVELALYRPPPERNTIHSSKNFNEMLINVNKLSSLMTALIKKPTG